MAAVRANTRFSLVVAGPELADDGNPAVRKLVELAANGDRRLLLLAGTFEDVTSRLPDLVPETEAEQHEARSAQ
jgi:hypothetical protein